MTKFFLLAKKCYTVRKGYSLRTAVPYTLPLLSGRGGGHKRGILGYGVLSPIKEVVWQIAVYFYVFFFILENSLIFLFAF